MGERGRTAVRTVVFSGVWLACGLLGALLGSLHPDHGMPEMTVFVYAIVGLIVGPILGLFTLDWLKRQEEAVLRAKNPYLRT